MDRWPSLRAVSSGVSPSCRATRERRASEHSDRSIDADGEVRRPSDGAHRTYRFDVDVDARRRQENFCAFFVALVRGIEQRRPLQTLNNARARRQFRKKSHSV